jgi:hypothetical protein
LSSQRQGSLALALSQLLPEKSHVRHRNIIANVSIFRYAHLSRSDSGKEHSIITHNTLLFSLFLSLFSLSFAFPFSQKYYCVAEWNLHTHFRRSQNTTRSSLTENMPAALLCRFYRCVGWERRRKATLAFSRGIFTMKVMLKREKIQIKTNTKFSRTKMFFLTLPPRLEECE